MFAGSIPALVTPFRNGEVDEGAWVGTPSGDDGPWWDEARFKPDDVLALWPAGEGIAALASVPAPCPKIETIMPATAASAVLSWKLPSSRFAAKTRA